jgi:hypothetical protein
VVPWVAALSAALVCAPTARADVQVDDRPIDPARALLLAVDRDDDDMDGQADCVQTSGVPAEDLREVVIQPGARGPVQISTLGGLRVIRQGRVVPTPFSIAADELPAPLALQASQTSLGGRALALIVTQDGRSERVQVHAVELAILAGDNRPLEDARDALALSHHVTNDETLPRGASYEARSPDLDNIRVQLFDAAAQGKRLVARLEAVSADGAHVRSALELELSRPNAGLPFRSGFVRLVGDEVDRTARGVAGQVLQVALRDRVRVVYRSPLGDVHQGLRVARPGDEAGPNAARLAVLRVVVLRAYPSGPPVIGVDDLSALRIVRDELGIANEIWLQCELTFGPPNEVSVTIQDPPASGLVSVSDGDGLPARGGAIHLRAEGQVLGPIETVYGAAPQDTALRIARALRRIGLLPTVTVNPPAVFGAGSSADVMVRRGDGNLALLEAIEGVPLSTDPQQRISLGGVDLGDGLQEFDNMTATGGTLEERTLVKAMSDDDPSTIDLFIVNRFTHGTRQGEAFISASSGPILNSVVLDRNGLRQRQTAWTMAHELGHVLLNQPLHPDNVGADNPALLMDSDNSRGTVNGPKRLLPGDCLRVRREAEVRADPPLLHPYDPRPEKRAGGARVSAE